MTSKKQDFCKPADYPVPGDVVEEARKRGWWTTCDFQYSTSQDGARKIEMELCTANHELTKFKRIYEDMDRRDAFHQAYRDMINFVHKLKMA